MEQDKAERERRDKRATGNTSRAVERTSEKFKDFVAEERPKKQLQHSNESPKPTSKDKAEHNQASWYSPVASTSNSRKRTLSPVPSDTQCKSRKTIERSYKPFSRLLEGVVLVLSGIQVSSTHQTQWRFSAEANFTCFIESTAQ